MSVGDGTNMSQPMCRALEKTNALNPAWLGCGSADATLTSTRTNISTNTSNGPGNSSGGSELGGTDDKVDLSNAKGASSLQSRSGTSTKSFYQLLDEVMNPAISRSVDEANKTRVVQMVIKYICNVRCAFPPWILLC
jgi:hypothetical protein